MKPYMIALGLFILLAQMGCVARADFHSHGDAIRSETTAVVLIASPPESEAGIRAEDRRYDACMRRLLPRHGRQHPRAAEVCEIEAAGFLRGHERTRFERCAREPYVPNVIDACLLAVDIRRMAYEHRRDRNREWRHDHPEHRHRKFQYYRTHRHGR